MYNFNLKEAAIFQAVFWERQPVFRFAKLLRKSFLILFIFIFLLFLYGFLFDAFSQSQNSLLLGYSIIFLVISLIFWLAELFFNTKLKKPKIELFLKEAILKPEVFNLAEFLSFEVAKAVWGSIRFAKSPRPLSLRRRTNLLNFTGIGGGAEINSSVLFYFLLKNNPELNFIFSRALLSLADIKEILEDQLADIGYRTIESQPSREFSFSSDFQETILDSLKIAQKKGHQRVQIGDTIAGLSKNNSIFQKILINNNLKNEDIENLTWWLESLEEKIAERKKFWEWKNLIKKGTLAKEWTAGYTVNLDRFSIDLTENVKRQGFPEIIGHQKEMAVVERVLSRAEINNVLLVGEPGVGRKSIVQGLAVKSALGQSLPEVNYKRVVALDIPALLTQTSGIEEAETLLDKIFQEVILAGNVILTINDFHNFVRTEIQPGVIDISGIISSYLPLPQFQIIAITTYLGLHKNIEQKPAILDLFEKVEVSEISERETLMFLERLSLIYGRKYKKFVSYQALKEIISLSKRYLPALPFPKKAAGVLEEVMVAVSATGEKIVLPEHISKIVSEKTQIPIGKIEIKEREVLLNLENLIHQRIINQEEAVREVSTALRRARAEVTVRKGPMGCFLFLGPTGVGKTETSKAVAEIYFGSEERMIRLDMSEFQAIGDIPRLIGALGEEGLLTTPVIESPFSLILLDEIEKAHANILNLFLQVLDEGHLTDGSGRKVDFKNSIIIATSNAAYQVILKAIEEKIEWSGVKEKLLNYCFERAIFRPEFINRFDAVVVFRPLTKENLLDIAELLLQILKKNLKEKGVEFTITQGLKEKIVELGYNPVFGARQMRRVIQDKVENILASALLSGELKRGEKIEIEPETFQIKKLL